MSIEPIPFVVTTMAGKKSTVLATTPEGAVAAAVQGEGYPVREVYRVLPFDHPAEIKARKKERAQ